MLEAMTITTTYNYYNSFRHIYIRKKIFVYINCLDLPKVSFRKKVTPLSVDSSNSIFGFAPSIY